MSQLQNTLHQYSFQTIGKRIMVVQHLPMTEYYNDPDGYCDQWAKEALAQLQWAELFGGAKVFQTGDSNNDFGRSPDQMIKWGSIVVVNDSRAGSRFDHQVRMYRSPNGVKLLKFLKDHKIGVFENCGGNHVLQSSMENMDESARICADLLGSSAAFIVAQDLPDINTPILAPLYKEAPAQMVADVQKANATICKYFPDTIKFGEFLMSLDAKDPINLPGLTLSLTNILGDGLVHYSHEFNKGYRYPFLSKYIQQKYLAH